jgi:DNA-binding response OmpR family regulator
MIPQEKTTPVSVVPEGTVLLLDDDPASRKLLRKLLDKEGYVVHEVSGVGAALAELRNTGIDLAIVNLNGHEGKIVVRSLRNIRRSCGVAKHPTFTVSGSAA